MIPPPGWHEAPDVTGLANIADYRLAVGDLDITPVVAGSVAAAGGRARRPRLVGLTVSEKRGEEADQLDLTLDDGDGQLAVPRLGATITLLLGWRQGRDVIPGLVAKGSYIVDSVEHAGSPDMLTLRARAADLTGAATLRREQSWHGTTIGAVIGEVAGRNALKPRCSAELAGVAVTTLVQSRESDLALLRRLGHAHDAVATVKHGCLIFARAGAGATATGAALPAVVIRRNQGDRHAWAIQKREQTTGIEAEWHDVGAAHKKRVKVGADGHRRRLSRVYASEADARAAAEAEQHRSGREPTTLRFDLALGRPDLAPETRVSVVGFKPVIDATRWLITEVTHTLTPDGFTTAIACEEAAAAPPGSAR